MKTWIQVTPWLPQACDIMSFSNWSEKYTAKITLALLLDVTLYILFPLHPKILCFAQLCLVIILIIRLKIPLKYIMLFIQEII